MRVPLASIAWWAQGVDKEGHRRQSGASSTAWGRFRRRRPPGATLRHGEQGAPTAAPLSSGPQVIPPTSTVQMGWKQGERLQSPHSPSIKGPGALSFGQPAGGRVIVAGARPLDVVPPFPVSLPRDFICDLALLHPMRRSSIAELAPKPLPRRASTRTSVWYCTALLLRLHFSHPNSCTVTGTAAVSR